MKTLQMITLVFTMMLAANTGCYPGLKAEHRQDGLTATATNITENAVIEKAAGDKDVACTTPSRPGQISGSPVACFRLPTNYSVPLVSGATSYSWTVVGGAIIGSKTGPRITINWGWAAKSVSVRAINSCGSSPSTALAITKVFDCSINFEDNK